MLVTAPPPAWVPGSRVERFGSSRYVLFLEWCTPRILVFTFRGHAEASAVAFFEPFVDEIIARGVRPQMFIDLWDATGYTTEFRQEITRWVTKIRPRVEPLQMLVRSKIVAMGVAVVRLASGIEPFVMHAERPRFNVALRAAIRAGA